MTYSPIRRLFVPFLSGALLVACQTSGASTDPGGAEADKESLAQEFLMESIRTERRDGVLHVSFELRNRRARPLPIAWAIRWLDSNGEILPTGTDWQEEVLEASAAMPISRTAPTALAAGFKLDISPPSQNH